MTDALIIAGRYRARSLLADTPTARVLAADDTANDAEVVVKIATATSRFRAASSAFWGAESLLFGPGCPADLVEHEARVLARLSCAGVAVRVDAGDHEGLPYLVTERVAAERIDRFATPPWPADRVEAAARAALAILADVHAAGVVHRDLKPSNLLGVERDGGLALTVVDFELATIDGAGVAGLVGSSAYRAPELVAALEPSLVVCDHRVDLYALGVVLYELLTGALPVGGQGDVDRAHAVDAAPSAGDHANTPAPLARLIDALLAKHPGERPASARAALRLLRDVPAASWIAPARAAAPSTSAELERLGWTADHRASLGPAQRQVLSDAVDEWLAARHAAVDGPTRAVVRENLARISADVGDLGAAVADAEAACRLAPDRASALVLHGEVELRLRAWRRAEVWFGRALAIEPGAVEALAGRAIALARLAGADAEAALAAAVDLPLDARWLARIATAAADLRMAGPAVAAALGADEADPTLLVLPPVTGQLVVSALPDAALPLVVACVQLALRAELSGRDAAAPRHFAQAVELARPILAGADAPPDPRLLLHAAIAEGEAGDAALGERLFEAASIGGLEHAIADRIGILDPLSECSSPQLLRLMALASVGQWRLARALVAPRE